LKTENRKKQKFKIIEMSVTADNKSYQKHIKTK